MQTKPANWAELFNSPHKTEYKFVIDGVDYMGGNISGTPMITKPLLDKPALGRVCTGSLSLTVLTKGMAAIPRAAQVNAYCRLRAASGSTVTEWLPQGIYYVSTRSGDSTLKLNCLDGMIKAGTTYRDKSSFSEWPQTMTAVVDEIASIMGVSIDPRTQIKTGPDYRVSYPNDDMLISEVLGMIAAAHGGNWIMTETGKLRLIPFSSAGDTAQQVLGKTHSGYKTRGKAKIFSRVILSDNAGNDFAAGDDTGAALAVKCDYATQGIASFLCNKTDSLLYGIVYEPYSVDGAYLDPALELGDTISVTDRNNLVHKVVLQSVKVNCTMAYTCGLSANTDEETENEYPYYTPTELSIARSIRTDQTYFGNRLTRSEGFVSELLVNGEAKARMTANASVFAMQTYEDGSWADKIYFDTLTNKYVITADVTIRGAVTAESLAGTGTTTINGSNITTGILQSKDGKIQLDLDAGTFTVGNKDLNAALTAVENSITLLASSQIFTKSADAAAYAPASIILTAQSTGTLSSYTWYRDDEILTDETSQTLTVAATDFTANSATYKVVGKDAAGNTYTDCVSVAKISDGVKGDKGDPGADGYTVVLSNEFIEVPVDTKRLPLTSASYSCKVNVYKGLTALTPTTGTLSASTFKVAVSNSVTGITVSQSTAGTLTVSVSTDNAIIDSAEIILTITVYNGPTLTAKITVRANMNDVTVTQQASITLNSNNIALKVSKDSIISEINQSAEKITISASKLDLNGYVTVSSLENGTTTINGSCITTGTIDAKRIDLSSYSTTAEINTMIDGLTLSAADTAFSGAFSISSVSGASYGFTYTSDGYYTSTNAGVDSSYSICKVTVSGMTSASILTLSCISYGESNYDFGVIGKLDTELSTTYTDDENNILKSFKGLSSASTVEVSIEIPAGSHYFYIKYRKDSSQSSYGDYFKFKKISSSGKASTIILKKNGIELSSATVSFTGFVTFNDLSTAGNTVINGANITTGQISADRIDTSDLHVKNVYFSTTNDYTIITSDLVSSVNAVVKVGVQTANSAWAQYLELYGTQIYLARPGYDPESDSYAMMIDMSSPQIIPANDGWWNIGSATNRFYEIYSRRFCFDDGVYLRYISGHLRLYNTDGYTNIT